MQAPHLLTCACIASRSCTPPLSLSLPQPQADAHLENAKQHAAIAASETAKAAKSSASDLKGRSSSTASDIKSKAGSLADDAKSGAKSAASNIKGAVKHGLHEAEETLEGAAHA
jgi:uncharacterized protein YjbJ (UPF0337 family)